MQGNAFKRNSIWISVLMALVFRNTLNVFPQGLLPPKGMPERRHNSNSCCMTEEKVPEGPAGEENVH